MVEVGDRVHLRRLALSLLWRLLGTLWRLWWLWILWPLGVWWLLWRILPLGGIAILRLLWLRHWIGRLPRLQRLLRPVILRHIPSRLSHCEYNKRVMWDIEPHSITQMPCAKLGDCSFCIGNMAAFLRVICR